MKNILQQGPKDPLNARLAMSVKFVDQQDISNSVVLDMGCGFGWCVNSLLNRGVKRITGVEISKEDLKAAKIGIKDKRANFVIAGALDLPFTKRSFNTVVCWEVIEHIPQNTEPKLFSEAYRVLKPNGSLYLSTPNNHWLATTLDPAWWLVGHRHYSIKQLTDYAKEAGFLVDKSSVKGRFWATFNILNMYVSKWVFRRNPFFAEFFACREIQEYESSDGYSNIFIKFSKREKDI